MHLLKVTQLRSQPQLRCIYPQSHRGWVSGPEVGPREAGKKQGLQAQWPGSYVLTRPAEATGSRGLQGTGLARLLCFTNARWLIWGTFAPL